MIPVPMNKVQVGNAPSPNLKQVRSKIGSMENASHKPGGGHIKIESKKMEFKVTPRIEAKNEKYQPKGGEKKVRLIFPFRLTLMRHQIRVRKCLKCCQYVKDDLFCTFVYVLKSVELNDIYEKTNFVEGHRTMK